MRHRGRGLFVLALALAPGSCFRGSRMGAAEVRAQGATPCFTVAPDELDDGMILHSVSVTDITYGPSDVWSSRATASGMLLDKDTCIRYAEPPPGYSRDAATALRPGRLYVVHVRASAPGRRGNTMGHSARFCLAPSPAGASRVVAMEDDSRKGLDPACREAR